MTEIKEREAAQEELLQISKIESIGQLTGGIAHDFNNLLTVILGNLELIERRNADIRLVGLVDGAKEAGRRGARLTQQLLAFARKQRLEPTALNLKAVVDGMSDLLASTVGVGVQVNVTSSTVGWWARGDRNQVEMMLLNLAANARDAMAGNGQLTIDTSQLTVTAQKRSIDLMPGDYVALTVSDEGSGMTPEVMARAVEPFFTTKDIGKGTGLGLSMAYGVAKQSGGALAIASEVRRGTTITVYLPRAIEASLEAKEDGAAVVEAIAPSGRILVVDDDGQVRALTNEFLFDLGYTVVLSDCGSDALARLGDGEQFDLLIVDFAMPGMNGCEVARRVHDIRPSLPILFLTGYANSLDITGLDRATVLRKPFQLSELDAAVTGALGRL